MSFRSFRTFLMMAALVSVAACSSTKDEGADMSGVDVTQQDGMAAGPLDGTQVQGAGDYASGAAPGTQQDLVVNVGDRVLFGYDQYDLTPEGQHTLEMQAEWLKRYPNVSVTISGHCDERGTREYNLALGERRANAVKNYLTALGIEGTRVNTVSYGKERPAVTGSTPEAWAQNRRGVTEVN